MTVLAGCHLIGGAGDLRFEETAGTTTSTGGGGQGAGGDLGGAGGASGCSDCSGPCQSCMGDVCMPLAVTTVCETDGVCDLAGNCAHGDIVWQRLYGDALDDGALAISSGDGMLHIGGCRRSLPTA
jgi:hypothetical protein